MKTANLVRAAALALVASAAGSAALAQADIYSRQMEMRMMDRNKDGMVSKDEFLAMIAKTWEMHVAEKKIRGGKMTEEQLRELEKVLGRSVGASAGG